jgi:hypothetical protein
MSIHDLLGRIRNVIRWLPIIWNDVDWDWYYLAKLIERKLEFMSEDARGWHHVGSEKSQRQMRVARALLARVMEDEYEFPLRPGWPPPYTGSSRDTCRLIAKQQEADIQRAFLIMAKHMRSWWD